MNFKTAFSILAAFFVVVSTEIQAVPLRAKEIQGRSPQITVRLPLVLSSTLFWQSNREADCWGYFGTSDDYRKADVGAKYCIPTSTDWGSDWNTGTIRGISNWRGTCDGYIGIIDWLTRSIQIRIIHNNVAKVLRMMGIRVTLND